MTTDNMRLLVIRRTLAVLAAAWCLVPAAPAKAWPTKPLSEALKQPAVVKNKPGAHGKAEVHTMTPAQFTAYFERERKHWATVAAAADIKSFE
jgi:tripartite-type tricarboxylate transporter receptor subunit TctC